MPTSNTSRCSLSIPPSQVWGQRLKDTHWRVSKDGSVVSHSLALSFSHSLIRLFVCPCGQMPCLFTTRHIRWLLWQELKVPHPIACIANTNSQQQLIGINNNDNNNRREQQQWGDDHATNKVCFNPVLTHSLSYLMTNDSIASSPYYSNFGFVVSNEQITYIPPPSKTCHGR